MWLALKQVERNSGAAGVDNMTVAQLRDYLREHWLRIKAELLAGSPLFEPYFSESSYGFRPRRSAHQALLKHASICAKGGAG
jgi:retron-type reverse transcriptase